MQCKMKENLKLSAVKVQIDHESESKVLVSFELIIYFVPSRKPWKRSLTANDSLS